MSLNHPDDPAYRYKVKLLLGLLAAGTYPLLTFEYALEWPQVVLSTGTAYYLREGIFGGVFFGCMIGFLRVLTGHIIKNNWLRSRAVGDAVSILEVVLFNWLCWHRMATTNPLICTSGKGEGGADYLHNSGYFT